MNSKDMRNLLVKIASHICELEERVDDLEQEGRLAELDDLLELIENLIHDRDLIAIELEKEQKKKSQGRG